MVNPAGAAGQFAASELAALLKLWRERYGAGPLPAESRLTEADLARWQPHLALIEREPDGRFRVRRFGHGLVRRFGRESTNEYIDRLAPDIRTSLTDLLTSCLSTGQPVTAEASVAFGKYTVRFAQVAVPVAADGDRIGKFLLAAYECGQD